MSYINCHQKKIPSSDKNKRGSLHSTSLQPFVCTSLLSTQVQVTKWLLQQLFYSVILCNIHRRITIMLWAPRIGAVLQQQRNAICTHMQLHSYAQRDQLTRCTTLLIYTLWLTEWVEFIVCLNSWQVISETRLFRQSTALVLKIQLKRRENTYQKHKD